jgi:trehalose 6-phosphate phosphatase
MPDDLPSLPPAPDLIGEAGLSLFLDFDGTLVDIAERHDAVVVDPTLGRLVAALADRLDGRVAVVSGRSAADILSYLGIADTLMPFAIAGSHGLEMRWSDGRSEAPFRPEGMDEAIAALEMLAEEHPGVIVEEKPYGAALHYRLAPEAGPACDALAEQIAAQAGFAIQHGKMVVELRMRGADKGDAVRRFMAEPPMAGTRPIFVGDDLTDEAGFRAAEELGGWGVLVGGPRKTAARYRLADVDRVHEWLGGVAGVTA